MTSLSDLNLSTNPFLYITPNQDGTRPLVWADMTEVKNKIQTSYTNCLRSHGKQIVLNWGPWGGGKTFSSAYFIQEYKSNSELTQIYITCPKDGAKASTELLKNIVDYLTFDKIQEKVKSLIGKYGEVRLVNLLTPRASKEYAKAICLIGSDNAEITDLMNRFLYKGLTKVQLTKLGLAKDLSSGSDISKFLSGLLSCFTEEDDTGNKFLTIWIDEMEDLIYFSPKNYKGFSQSLRDLMDSLPNRFILFMNFTLAEGEEETINLILGGAVWSRITKKIKFTPFSIENALNYSLTLLNDAKINKNKSTPISTNILDKLLRSIPINDLTPRQINKTLNSILEFTMDKGKKNIDDSLFISWASENANSE